MCSFLTVVCFDVRIIYWQIMVTMTMRKRKINKLEVVALYKSLKVRKISLWEPLVAG
jgi:hypothetical protein